MKNLRNLGLGVAASLYASLSMAGDANSGPIVQVDEPAMLPLMAIAIALMWLTARRKK